MIEEREILHRSVVFIEIRVFSCDKEIIVNVSLLFGFLFVFFCRRNFLSFSFVRWISFDVINLKTL